MENELQETLKTLAAAGQMIRQRQSLTISDTKTLFGCCLLFDQCADGALMGLTMEGVSKFLDWLQFIPSAVCEHHKAFLNWVRPDQAQGACTPGYLADPCADPNSFEFGICDWRIHDFGRLRRQAPVRDITYNGVRFCDTSPRIRLNGTPVTNQTEWDMLMATEVLLQDLKGLMITGNSATGGQWDGLNRIIRTGYTDTQGRRCESMDSIVIDWNGNTLAGGAGITWNGAAVGAAFSLVDVLRYVVKQIRWRVSLAPPMAAQGLRRGDVVLMGPTWLLECVLDAYTCWSVCAGRQYNEVNLNGKEAVEFRNGLMGGMFGDGEISLDGFPIPLLAYDWQTTTGPTRGDLYILTRGAGAMRTLYGEHLDMRTVAKRDFSVVDGGRLLTWSVFDHTCEQQVVEMRPRLVGFAPWSLARIQDVVCNTPNGPFSPDPCDTSFFPESSFSTAACL